MRDVKSDFKIYQDANICQYKVPPQRDLPSCELSLAPGSIGLSKILLLVIPMQESRSKMYMELLLL
jgi:hypothetical protein